MITVLANPAWLIEMRKHDGLHEKKDLQHNPIIQAWLKELGAGWDDDETPWCGTAVAHCLKSSGRGIPKHWYRAAAYADPSYGTVLQKPCVGALAIYTRKGGGHVTIVAGIDKQGRVMCFGGNQSDAINVMAFEFLYTMPAGTALATTTPTDTSGNAVAAVTVTQTASAVQSIYVSLTNPMAIATLDTVVKSLYIIDATAFDATYGTTYATLPDADVIAIMRAQLLRDLPTSVRLRDSATGVTRKISVNNGSITVV